MTVCATLYGIWQEKDKREFQQMSSAREFLQRGEEMMESEQKKLGIKTARKSKRQNSSLSSHHRRTLMPYATPIKVKETPRDNNDYNERGEEGGLVASKIIIDTICRNNSKRIGSKVNWSHATSRWSDVCDCEDYGRGGGGLRERGQALGHRVQQ